MTRRTLLVVTSVVIAPVVALGLLDAGPNVPIVVALALLAAACVGLLRPLARSLAPPLPVVEQPDLPGAPPDLRITSVRQALASRGDDDRLNARIRQQLVAAADDELLASHGIDRRRDPDAARRVLGATLFEFVEDPEAAPSIRELERIVTDIERLDPNVA